MNNNTRTGFTFVELIVVITIMAILATIGFSAYQAYLKAGRDTNRLVQLKDVHDGLELLSINSRLPFPEDMIELQASGSIFSYQGFAGHNILKAIGYDGGGQDIEYGMYMTYMLSKNARDFQLMSFVSDINSLSLHTSHSFANFDFYQGLFPKLIGKPLGIIIEDETNIPIQENPSISASGSFDISSVLGGYKVYLSDSIVLNSSRDDLSQILPNNSCNRIKSLGRDSGNGLYFINPKGVGVKRVYCDMETDGGGWMYAGFIHEDSNYHNVYFDRDFGGYSIQRAGSGSSYMLNLSDFSDTEALFLYNTNNIEEAYKSDNLLILRYGDGFPGMNSGPLSSVVTRANFFSGYPGVEYRTGFNKAWDFTRQNIGWGIESNDESQSIITIRGSFRGVEKFTGLWGANPDVRIRDNAAYIYIR